MVGGTPALAAPDHSTAIGGSLLYYNATTGDGAVGRIDLQGQHTTVRSLPNHFSQGWTQMVFTPQGILFYNAANGAAAVGMIDGTSLSKSALRKGKTLCYSVSHHCSC